LSRRFTRTREDFTCFNCGAHVAGDGYTNHCSSCLWSLHVDVHPGDRAAGCRAPMEPVDILFERGRFIVVHRCTGCRVRRRCRATAHDDVARWFADRPG
jgi:hypothetical protein